MLRRDIQFLRGFAVLVVVLYHSQLGIIEHGYLGVDIFFVISGFLITSIILKKLESNTFSFADFYMRRAKRLLPALYSTLLFTTIAAIVFLTEQQWQEYLEQFFGAITFTANMVLPTQIGYFDNAAEGKPLLHIWSLSLEEQYYFCLPLVLFLVTKKFRPLVIVGLLIASICWCLTWVISSENSAVPLLWRIAESSKQEWAFFLFPTRAWELLAGSMSAWIMLRYPTINLPNYIKYIALIVLGILCVKDINSYHPHIESLLAVIATTLIILGNKEWLIDTKMTRSVEKVGDWSYSIYLVHWPIFAFAFLAFVGDIPTTIKIILIFASLILGFAQFQFIETPFRQGKFQNVFSTWKKVALSTATLAIIPVSLSYYITTTTNKNIPDLQINYGLSAQCNPSFDKQGALKKECNTSSQPQVAIWGDSYAMHLVPGLIQKNQSIAQITKSYCGPLLGIAPVTAEYNSTWAKACLMFNKNALEYIVNNDSITHVVISSSLSQYTMFDNGSFLTDEKKIRQSSSELKNALQQTITELQNHNKIPIIISPPPRSGFDIGNCLVRKHSDVAIFRESCDIIYSDYVKHERDIISLLDDVSKTTFVINLSEELCNDTKCKTSLNSVPLYRDTGHLSIQGSKTIFRNTLLTNFR